MRALMTTEISGLSVFEAFTTLGASMPVTVIDGLFQMRLRIVPRPTGETPAGSPASSRSVSSVYSGVSASRSVSPATATAPSSSHSVASSVTVAIIASGTAPPNMPECEACSRVRTRRVKRVLPRSDTVSAGVLSSQLPESATTITSARSASALSERNCANDREPASSSPSKNSATPRSNSSPIPSLSARSAARWAMMPALSSAAPRP